MPPTTSISPDTSTIPVPNNLTLSASTGSGPQSLPHPTHRALLLHLQNEPDAISELQKTLTASLASTGWPDRVRALALDLLRSGTCTTFPELLAEVLRRAKVPPLGPPPPGGSSNGHLAAPPYPAASTAKENSNTSKEINGTSGKKDSALANGTHATIQRQGQTSASSSSSSSVVAAVDVRIPLKTVEVGVAFLKAKVRDVVEVVEPGDLEERGSSGSDED